MGFLDRLFGKRPASKTAGAERRRSVEGTAPRRPATDHASSRNTAARDASPRMGSGHTAAAAAPGTPSRVSPEAARTAVGSPAQETVATHDRSPVAIHHESKAADPSSDAQFHPTVSARVPQNADDSELDFALDGLFKDGAAEGFASTEASGDEFDKASLRELFGGIAGNHSRPVKNLVFELRRRTATKEWVEICRPVMTTLIQAAEATGLAEAARRMTDFDEALSLAASGAEPGIDETARELVLSCYDEMAQALPEAFQQGEDERRRETIIIHALLKQIPDVGHVTFQRLFGAGLTTLEALFLASEEDLVLTTGIPDRLCARICARMRDYRHELQKERAASGEGERREQLRRLLDELRQEHQGYEEAAAREWTDPALAERKREHRQGRQICALKIEVLLADMGEPDLAEQVQRMPFGLRIEALERFLAGPSLVPAGA